MKAIIKTGGKQYTVAVGDVIEIEKLDSQAGDVVEFSEVLATIDNSDVKTGSPNLAGAKVTATVVEQGRGKKITIFKYKPKKGYHKKQGHRQSYTKVKIDSIVVA